MTQLTLEWLTPTLYERSVVGVRQKEAVVKYTVTVERTTVECIDLEVEAGDVETAEGAALFRGRTAKGDGQREVSVRVIGNIHDEAGTLYV